MPRAGVSPAAIARSAKARQTQPSDSALPLGDEYYAKHAEVHRLYPERETIKPTTRGYSANFVVGARKSVVGVSPLGDYVNSETHAVGASPAINYTDNQTKSIEVAKIDPTIDQTSTQKIDLTGEVPYTQETSQKNYGKNASLRTVVDRSVV